MISEAGHPVDATQNYNRGTHWMPRSPFTTDRFFDKPRAMSRVNDEARLKQTKNPAIRQGSCHAPLDTFTGPRLAGTGALKPASLGPALVPGESGVLDARDKGGRRTASERRAGSAQSQTCTFWYIFWPL